MKSTASWSRTVSALIVTTSYRRAWDERAGGQSYIVIRSLWTLAHLHRCHDSFDALVHKIKNTAQNSDLFVAQGLLALPVECEERPIRHISICESKRSPVQPKMRT